MLKAVDHFRAREKAQDAKDRERQKWFVAAREQRRVKEERLDNEEDVFLDAMTAMVLADAAEIKTFQTKLDQYDEATVKALMQNQKQLDAVQERIGDMLSRAHQLDDGRRVFKTQDGKRVFDEHGAAVSAKTIHPNEISNSAPFWETYKAATDERASLRHQRQKIHEFQKKLDHARERSNEDDFTKDELKELDEDLAGSMPSTIAEHLPEGVAPPRVALTSEFVATANAVTPIVKSAATVALVPAP